MNKNRYYVKYSHAYFGYIVMDRISDLPAKGNVDEQSLIYAESKAFDLNDAENLALKHDIPELQNDPDFDLNEMYEPDEHDEDKISWIDSY